MHAQATGPARTQRQDRDRLAMAQAKSEAKATKPILRKMFSHNRLNCRPYNPLARSAKAGARRTQLSGTLP